MKKIILFLSAVSLSISCTSDDNSSNNTNNNSKITPPAWIQGTWKYEEPHYSYYYRLTSNNICQIIAGGENCMKEYIELYQNTAGNIYTNVEQKITETEYYCKITVSSSSNIYHFEKLSNNTIKDVIMSNTVGSTVTLNKQ